MRLNTGLVDQGSRVWFVWVLDLWIRNLEFGLFGFWICGSGIWSLVCFSSGFVDEGSRACSGFVDQESRAWFVWVLDLWIRNLEFGLFGFWTCGPGI
ncbi:hypothetical protein KM043_001203 [Ampulex compressa]|nr:hypothetical protein KM043_001203 [Ampulex compressa]